MWDISSRNIKRTAESTKTYQNPIFLRVDILLTVFQNLMIIAFSKRAKEDLSDALEYFAQTVTDFLLLSAEKTKNEAFWHFNNHNSGSKHDKHFSYTLLALSVYIFRFCISRPSKFCSMVSHFALYSGLYNTHLYAKDDTFKPVNIYILFVHKIG